jgi:hypothetical protein
MKRLLLAATLGLTTITANAVCPATITGKFSGSGQYTEQAVINNVPIISYIEYHVVSVIFSGNTMTVSKEFFAATGSGQPATIETPNASTVTFDKNTCTGQIGGYNDPLYFVVSDSGNSIQVVHGKAPNSKYLYAEKWELKRQ